MTNLLRIDTSTKPSGSHSKDFSNEIETRLKMKNKGLKVVYRDLNKIEIPHLSQEYIEASLIPKDERVASAKMALSLSDELIKELKVADTVLISVPMFNFSIQSLLKAYIDHICRMGEIFSMDESGFKGLINNKKLIIVAAYGAEFSQIKGMDFVEAYLKSIFEFIGFDDIQYISIEGTSMLSTEQLNLQKKSFLEVF